jgi:hypothetical protein
MQRRPKRKFGLDDNDSDDGAGVGMQYHMSDQDDDNDDDITYSMPATSSAETGFRGMDDMAEELDRTLEVDFEEVTNEAGRRIDNMRNVIVPELVLGKRVALRCCDYEEPMEVPAVMVASYFTNVASLREWNAKSATETYDLRELGVFSSDIAYFVEFVAQYLASHELTLLARLPLSERLIPERVAMAHRLGFDLFFRVTNPSTVRFEFILHDYLQLGAHDVIALQKFRMARLLLHEFAKRLVDVRWVHQVKALKCAHLVAFAVDQDQQTNAIAHQTYDALLSILARLITLQTPNALAYLRAATGALGSSERNLPGVGQVLLARHRSARLAAAGTDNAVACDLLYAWSRLRVYFGLSKRFQILVSDMLRARRERDAAALSHMVSTEHTNAVVCGPGIIVATTICLTTLGVLHVTVSVKSRVPESAILVSVGGDGGEQADESTPSVVQDWNVVPPQHFVFESATHMAPFELILQLLPLHFDWVKMISVWNETADALDSEWRRQYNSDPVGGHEPSATQAYVPNCGSMISMLLADQDAIIEKANRTTDSMMLDATTTTTTTTAADQDAMCE